MATVKTGLAFLGCAALLAATACHQPSRKSYKDEGDGTSGYGPAGVSAGSGRQLITIPVALQQRSAGLSLLAAADDFEIEMTDCASQHTSTATVANSALVAYRHDTGCIAKLNSFEFNGATYEPTVGDPFTTWQQNDTATFVNTSPGDPSDRIYVIVDEQLDDPIAGGSSVLYRFSTIVEGTAKTLPQGDISEAYTMDVDNEPPPDFKIEIAEITDINGDGAGIFRFTMECNALIVGNVCSGVDMPAKLKYALVKDTFGGNVTLEDANDIFDGTIPATVTDVLVGDVSVAGGPTTNGGFIAEDVQGPDEMANNREMIFIIQAGGLSYQWFKVTVSALVNPN